ncbi:uncharacterized protein LOC135123605 isoform X2 [Zophobas morio]|uniref:uncharacterized protein LOC135123605 isoform X2 n=1 Tax=Zophobas morio TaxID=2755281 RepID=UPI003082BEAB
METFKRRSGTTTKDIDYENLNIANIGINCATDDEVEDFYLSSNDENFGDFDDIVIKITSAAGSNVSALQLKHNVEGNLHVAKLKQENGDFSLKKYFNSAQNINCHVDNFILCTNLKFGVKEHTRFCLDGEDFQIGLSPFYPKDKIFQLSDTLNHCYRFHVVEDDCLYDYSPEILMYRQFFEKFYFFVNQDNSKILLTKIVEKFTKLFLANQTECDVYLKMISRWSQQQGEKYKLCKNWVQHAIAHTLLSSRIKPLCFGSSVNENMKILREAISAFTVTVFENNTYHKIKYLWGDAMSQIKDTKELNKTREMYHLSHPYIETLDNLDLKLLNTLLWLNSKCPIIVTEDAVAHKLIKLCPQVRIILLIDDINKENISHGSVFRNLSDLKPPHLDKVLEKFNVSIQGKEEVSLKNAFSLDFTHTIRTSHLVEMLEGPYTIGGLLENLPEPYIERNLCRNVINIKYFQRNDENTSVVIDDVQNTDSLNQKLKNCSIHNIENYLNERDSSVHSTETERDTTRINVFITRNKCHKTQFEAICDKNKDKKIFHHLRFIDEDSFEWIQSKGNISSLEEYKVNKFLLSEKEMWCRNLANNINLIISNPGMGKSELMNSLKNTCPSKIWIIFIKPTDISLFSKYIINDNNRSDNLDSLQNFLLNEKYKWMDQVAKEFLQVFIKQNQVFYVWDALDEIPTEYLATITNLIVELSKKGHPQWITSRFQLKRLLETKFNVLSLNLCQFSEQEQTTYIKKRLENIYITEQFEEIISKIRSSFVLVEHKEILAIPLQIFMLTNLLRQDISKYFKLLNDIFVLTDLYHYFVEEKMKVYFEKKSLSESAVKILETAILKYHQNLALKTLFSKEFLKTLNIDIENSFEDFKEEYVSVGLLTKITSKPACFIHNSFAEYFAALYFSQNQRLSSIFVDVIFGPRYVNVRFFFDLLLAKESPPHVAVLYKNINVLENYEKEVWTSTDAGGRSVLHIASSWGQRHPRLDVTTTFGAYIVDDSGCPSVEVEKEENVKILNYLLNICDLYQCDALFKMTPLMYAQKSNCLANEIKILKQQNNNLIDLPIDQIVNILYYATVCEYVDVIEHLYLEMSTSFSRPRARLLNSRKSIFNAKNKMGTTLLYLASERDYEKIVKYLLILGADINFRSTDGITPLYVACQKGHENILELLVTLGANINLGNVKGATPLYIACEVGNENIVKRLIAHGANINQSRKIGATPLYIACQFGYENIVELLIKSGAKVNLDTVKGATPLMISSQEGHIKVVERLLLAGAKVNHSTIRGVTPLFLACETGHENVVHHLIAFGANINQSTVMDATALYIACQNGHENIAERLIAFGANINQCSYTGVTPLYIACERGYVNIVELLVTSGADINLGNEDGTTPLFISTQFGHIKIVERLISMGAKINQGTHCGATPLYIACEIGNENIAERLIAFGADINQSRSNGCTPLYIACEKGHEKIVELLLVSGADINRTAFIGRTPLSVALKKGHTRIAELFGVSDSSQMKKVKKPNDTRNCVLS